MLLQLMDILSSLVRKAGSLIYGQSGKSRGIQTGTEYWKQGWNGDKAPLSPPAAIYHLGSRAGVRGSFVILRTPRARCVTGSGVSSTGNTVQKELTQKGHPAERRETLLENTPAPRRGLNEINNKWEESTSRTSLGKAQENMKEWTHPTKRWMLSIDCIFRSGIFKSKVKIPNRSIYTCI